MVLKSILKLRLRINCNNAQWNAFKWLKLLWNVKTFCNLISICFIFTINPHHSYTNNDLRLNLIVESATISVHTAKQTSLRRRGKSMLCDESGVWNQSCIVRRHTERRDSRGNHMTGHDHCVKQTTYMQGKDYGKDRPRGKASAHGRNAALPCPCSITRQQ